MFLSAICHFDRLHTHHINRTTYTRMSEGNFLQQQQYHNFERAEKTTTHINLYDLRTNYGSFIYLSR